MLTRTGATRLKLCRAESLYELLGPGRNSLACHILTLFIRVFLEDPFQGQVTSNLKIQRPQCIRLVYLNHICVCFRA